MKDFNGEKSQTLKILEHIFEYCCNPGASVWVFLSMSRKYKMIQDALLIITKYKIILEYKRTYVKK